MTNMDNILFVCVGSMLETGDSLGPVVGSMLDWEGYKVVGTKRDPVHARNLKQRLNYVKNNYRDYFVVGIDSSLGIGAPVGTVIEGSGPLKPGRGVGRDLPEFGDYHIYGIVGHYIRGFEFEVLKQCKEETISALAGEVLALVRYRFPFIQNQLKINMSTQLKEVIENI